MRYEIAVDVDGSVERVWDVLADVESWPGWTPTMTSVRRLEDGAFGLDSTAEVRQPKLGRNVWRVSGWEPGRRFEWTTAGPGVTTRADHRIEALDGGRARVTLEVEMTGPLAGVVSLLAGGMTRRFVDTEAASLKKHCETGRPGA